MMMLVYHKKGDDKYVLFLSMADWEVYTIYSLTATTTIWKFDIQMPVQLNSKCSVTSVEHFSSPCAYLVAGTPFSDRE